MIKELPVFIIHNFMFFIKYKCFSWIISFFNPAYNGIIKYSLQPQKIKKLWRKRQLIL